MTEFANRIDTQRDILKSVNSFDWENEPLMSLTQKSIDRWSSANGMNSETALVKLLVATSKKLFFLANKSQEQITQEYEELSLEVTELHEQISSEINKDYA
ncbi:hypothetical protein V5T82_02350 [Magnetovibrio sp. PR-2]|uniref:hypothetical protein n=1 Tax=Magnetovibrio sp. PR-2 TaxID=3120356 RepID=UPI002FCE1BF1